MKLFEKISKLRKRKGLSQEELANELEVSRQSVFKWECGENTPDLDKIKKLSKLFNVNLDILLDDDKELDDSIAYPNENLITNQGNKFRKVFDSEFKVSTNKQADYEHGYGENGKVDGYDFDSYLSNHDELIKKKNYTKVLRIQHDVLVDFFIDENNKTFGFFYDGAAQFVCPFECLASFNLSNSGYNSGTTNTTVIGVGIGSNPSIGVGSMPLSKTRKPRRYDLTISYFNVDGSLKDYKIEFLCIRTYITKDNTANSVEELYMWENMMSDSTNKKLSEVCTYLNGIKESVIRLKSQNVNLTDIDVDELSLLAKEEHEKKISTLVIYKDKDESMKKKKNITYLIIGIVVCVLIAAIITTCSIFRK